HQAVRQVVGDNAKSHAALSSLCWLSVFAATHARPRRYADYLAMLGSVRKKKWRKAMFLDRLLADAFITQVRRTRPDFATLFLNAAAHIQHHYMFSSSAYEGELSNPEWHVRATDDPLLDVYQLYDQVVGDVRTHFPEARLMIATGLHQDPYHELAFYWRLRDHDDFLQRHDIAFENVDALMSRDFVVTCADAEQAVRTESQLASFSGDDGLPLFEIDNRGETLFVMLTYPKDIPADFLYRYGAEQRTGLREAVAFVAIKNGKHNGIGYFCDTGAPEKSGDRMPLTSMPDHIWSALCPDVERIRTS
ncbi:MAG: hypothetical protein AAFQ99_11720, partial [Pseudomonadota bacterium]